MRRGASVHLTELGESNVNLLTSKEKAGVRCVHTACILGADRNCPSWGGAFREHKVRRGEYPQGKPGANRGTGSEAEGRTLAVFCPAVLPTAQHAEFRCIGGVCSETAVFGAEGLAWGCCPVCGLFGR